MITYEEVRTRLFEHEDAEYRAFHKKLLKNEAVRVIGVRTPVLRKLAKEWKGEWKNFLTFPDEFYEVTFLKCAVCAFLPFEEFTGVIDGLVPLIDNWAVCDCFAPQCIAKNREAFLPFVQKYLNDGREFVTRFALVTLLRDYMERKYLPLIFASVRALRGRRYYVNMASAWLIAEVLVKFYEEGVSFLNEAGLEAEVHNKAIQKARESFRLNAEQKALLAGMKIIGKKG